MPTLALDRRQNARHHLLVDEPGPHVAYLLPGGERRFVPWLGFIERAEAQALEARETGAPGRHHAHRDRRPAHGALARGTAGALRPRLPDRRGGLCRLRRRRRRGAGTEDVGPGPPIQSPAPVHPGASPFPVSAVVPKVAFRCPACTKSVCPGTHACETMGFAPPHRPRNAACFPPPDRADTPSPFARRWPPSAVTTALHPRRARSSAPVRRRVSRPRAPRSSAATSPPTASWSPSRCARSATTPTKSSPGRTSGTRRAPCALQAVPVTVMEGLSDPQAQALVTQHYPTPPAAEPVDPIAQARAFKAELERLRKTSPCPYRLLSALTGYPAHLPLPRHPSAHPAPPGAAPHPFRRAAAPPRALPRHRARAPRRRSPAPAKSSTGASPPPRPRRLPAPTAPPHGPNAPARRWARARTARIPTSCASSRR